MDVTSLVVEPENPSKIISTRPLTYIPGRHTITGYLFAQVLEEKMPETGYTAKDIENVVYKLSDDVAIARHLQNEATEQNTILQSKVEELEMKNAQLTELGKEASTKMSTLQTMNRCHTYNIKRLQEDLDASSLEVDENSRLAEEVSDLNYELDSTRQRLACLETASSDEIKDLANTKNDLQTLHSDYLELSSSHEELKSEKEELQEQWDAELESRTQEIVARNQTLDNDIGTLQIEAGKYYNKWDRALREILRSSVTGEDVPSALLEPVLRFPRIQNFEFRVTKSYPFSQEYIGMAPPNRQDISLVDIIRWSRGIPTILEIPRNDRDQVVWLEINLLEQIRTAKRRDTAVLLAFDLLFQKIESHDWLTRCMAYVKLAVLASQYRMRDEVMWSKMVSDLAEAHPSLDDDLLAQSCIAYLALTTGDPTKCIKMNPALVEAYHAGHLLPTTPIPEIVALNIGGAAASVRIGETDIVITRFMTEEVVFFREGRRPWICSLQPIKIYVVRDGCLEITWGSGAGKEARVGPYKDHAPLYSYLFRYYKATIAAIDEEQFEQTLQVTDRLVAGWLASKGSET